MKANMKSKLFGGILSDGSVRIQRIPAYNSQQSLDVDLMNHPVWTGRRPKKQTEISAFIGRLGPLGPLNKKG